MNGNALLRLAQALAEVAHEGQCRKGNGEPYFDHVSRVADRCYGWKEKSVAYLHDTLEDTAITGTVLFAIFPRDVVNSVITLTRQDDDESYEQYITDICAFGSSLALNVKLADLEDNLSDIDTIDPGVAGDLERRYLKAKFSIVLEIERRKFDRLHSV